MMWSLGPLNPTDLLFEPYPHYYDTVFQMQSVLSLMLHPEYVSVFAGPTNVEDPVQLLMKDAGESKASPGLAVSITAIIRHAGVLND